MKRTPGGLLGYCSSKCMTSLNVPSSKGVSDGPMITAFLITLSAYVCAENPNSLCCKGRIIPGHDIIGDGRG